jgi:hypothetical protein
VFASPVPAALQITCGMAFASLHLRDEVEWARRDGARVA